MKENKQKKELKENVMHKIRIEKVVLSVGGTGDYLAKGVKLLNLLTGRVPAKTRATRRIPSLSVRPGLEIGCVVTVRKDAMELLKKMLLAVDNKLRKSQVANNAFSFGIEEYIEIPGIEYQRDIGIMGLDVTVVFKRNGRRVKLRKIKRGRIPKRQIIKPEEIIEFMQENYETEFTNEKRIRRRKK